MDPPPCLFVALPGWFLCLFFSGTIWTNWVIFWAVTLNQDKHFLSMFMVGVIDLIVILHICIVCHYEAFKCFIIDAITHNLITFLLV